MINDDEDSSSDDEDEDGELINDKVYEKFMTTLAKIKGKNKDIYNKEK